jgi:tetratricopeptide (TPR) repeat protein
VADLFELGDMPAWHEERARHARLAEELRLPVFQWYTPLWAATEAVLAGRYDEAETLTVEAEEAGIRAGDRNAELFAGLVRFCGHVQREAFDEMDIKFVEGKIANSPAGIAYRASYAWILDALGESQRAREELQAVMAQPHPFDTNWLTLQAECAEASVRLGETTFATTLYQRLAPYAGRPATAGRAAFSYGAIDRVLGGLAAVLGHQDDAIRHLRDAVAVNDALGCTVWRGDAERQLAALRAKSDS